MLQKAVWHHSPHAVRAFRDSEISLGNKRRIVPQPEARPPTSPLRALRSPECARRSPKSVIKIARMRGQGRQLLPKVATRVLQGRQLWPKVAKLRKVAKTTRSEVGDLGDLRPKPGVLSALEIHSIAVDSRTISPTGNRSSTRPTSIRPTVNSSTSSVSKFRHHPATSLRPDDRGISPYARPDRQSIRLRDQPDGQAWNDGHSHLIA